MKPPAVKLKTLIDSETLARRVAELGREISEDYKGESLYICCILKGAFVFAADLIRHIDCPLRVDFMRLASYGNATESRGKVKITKDVELSFEGCHVLIVEDIVDTGYTMKFLVDRLKLHKPKSVRICAMLDKRSRREIDVPVDYVGFTIGDGFVLGYGLDYAEFYRDLSDICVMETP